MSCFAGAALAADAEPALGGGIISEVRAGALLHGTGPLSHRFEGGVDGNLEIMFGRLEFLDFVWSPRPHLGLSVNSQGDTSQAYFGLSWQWDLKSNFFIGFSAGGTVHNGETRRTRPDKAALGCPLLFRLSVEPGILLGRRHSLSLMFDHASNAYICSPNDGMETLGLRYGYRF